MVSELLTIIHTNYVRVIISGDFNAHMDNQSDTFTMEFLNRLNFINFTQHVTQPTHNRGHTLDHLIIHGLSVNISSVIDVGLSDHFCVFFNVCDPIQQDIPQRTVRERYLTNEVTANFIHLLRDTPADILPTSCDFSQ